MSVSEYEAIEAVVRAFVQGLHQGKADQVQAQFARDAVVNGYYEGECIRQDLHGYMAVVRRMPPPVLLGEEMEMHLTGLEVAGTIASVRVSYRYEALDFTDYLSLLKIGTDWKIVSRLFRHD